MSEESKEELKQDLNELGERPRSVFVIRLLMDKLVVCRIKVI